MAEPSCPCVALAWGSLHTPHLPTTRSPLSFVGPIAHACYLLNISRLFSEHVLLLSLNMHLKTEEDCPTRVQFPWPTGMPRPPCPSHPTFSHRAAWVPVCVLGPQQPQVALVGKHVFILNEEAVCAQGME